MFGLTGNNGQLTDQSIHIKSVHKSHINNYEGLPLKKVFTRNYNAITSAEEIFTTTEEVGFRVVYLYLIRNKQTGYFTGLMKATLLGNNIMNKWLDDKKANLGGVRRPIERERKSHACNNCFRFDHKMDK